MFKLQVHTSCNIVKLPKRSLSLSLHRLSTSGMFSFVVRTLCTPSCSVNLFHFIFRCFFLLLSSPFFICVHCTSVRSIYSICCSLTCWPHERKKRKHSHSSARTYTYTRNVLSWYIDTNKKRQKKSEYHSTELCNRLCKAIQIRQCLTIRNI